MTPDEANKRRIQHIADTLATLIAWMAQSANSPISREDAQQLLRKLDGDDA